MSVNGTKILALNSSSNGYVPLKADASGRLECSVNEIELTAETINLNTDGLETLQTNIFNKFDAVVGHINNTGAIGDGSDVLKSMSLGYDRANGKGVSFLVDSAGKLDIQHIESIDTRLDNSIGAINNTGAVGEGSSQLRVVPLGYDRANGVGRSILVDSLGHIQTDIVSGTITLPSGASTEAKQDTVIGHLDGVETLIGTTNSSIATMDAVIDNILTKNTEIDTVLDTISGKITACNTGAVVISSGAVTATLSATDNNVLDAIATDGDNIQTLLTTIDGVLDNQLTKQGEIDAVLDTINGKITACNTGAVVISSGAVTATLSATDNNVLDAIATDGDNIQTLLTTIDGVLDSSLTKQGEIDAVLDTISGKITACNTGAVVISSGAISLPSGASTGAKQDTVIGHLDGVETSLTAITGYVDGIETLIGTTNSSIATMDAVMDNILTKNTEIDTVLDTISGKITACNTGAVVISSGAVTATLSATDNNVLDAIDAVLDTIKVDTEAIETAVETLVGGGTTGEWLASASLADTTYSAVLDCSAFKTVRIMGIASATIGMAGMPILGSQTSGGTYYTLQQSEKITENQTSIGGVTKFMLSAVIENTPKFLKVYNNTGGSKTFELDYVGYVN